MRLREYQQEAIDSLYKWFQENDGNALVVLPTGSGKSLVQAKICQDALKWENTRVLCLTHVRELISQNHRQLNRLWPDAPTGIYCAGLDKKQHQHPITFASIQSVHKKAELIGWRDLIIIDEVHLLSDENKSMYRKFLQHMASINPSVRIIGLSATPFRLKSGYLHEGEGTMFAGIAFELPLMRLIKEGYLCSLTSKVANTQGDIKKLGIQGGEFAIKEAITEFDRQEMTRAAVNEMIEKGHDRKTWLIFCVSIEHAEHVQKELIYRGIDTGLVCDKTPKEERDSIKNRFDKGLLRAVVNVAVWTTGLDIVGIDMIVLLRPTMSPGLLIQMLGRGMRPVYAAGANLETIEGRLAGISNGPKPNCLVLDMACNLALHGPITHIAPKSGKRKDKAKRDGKMCPKCRTINILSATECADCGALFEGIPRTIKHTLKAGSSDILSEAPQITEIPSWLVVKKISYDIHNKVGVPASLKVTYNCRPNYISEYIGFASLKEFPRKKAAEWWRIRGGSSPIPQTAIEALSRLKEIEGYWTAKIKAQKNGSFKNVVGYDIVRSNTNVNIINGNLGQNATQKETQE